MKEREKMSENMQEIRGVLSLKQVQEIDPDLKIKIGIVRNCRIIYSQVFQLEPKQVELKYNLAFKSEGPKAMGVNVVAGPGDVPDEKLRSLDVYEQRVPAKAFKERVAHVDLVISPRLYGRWKIVCRRHTIRGRVICRRIIWDRREHRFVVCDSPVRGAKVTAYDIDTFWWWCRRDEVGSDFTDLNGNFEITFNWCCWMWRPWFFRDWRLEPELVQSISDLLKKIPIRGPIPLPDPEPDFSIFERLVENANVSRGGSSQALTEIAPPSQNDFVQLGKQLIKILPDATDLKAMHIWPWWPFFDCKPDIIFRVTQDCGRGEQVIYSESCAQTRWDISPVLNGVTLIANSKACCAPVCCDDQPDDDCLVFQGVGCGSYPITSIEQDPIKPLLGLAEPGTNDRPFGGSMRILGVFGTGSDVDYYKLQYQRISPSSTNWADLPKDQVGVFYRGHWLGVFPWVKWEKVQLETVSSVDSREVLMTKKRYRELNPDVSTTVDPNNDDWLTVWATEINGTPNLIDGIYQLRVVGYRYNSATKTLYDEEVMPLCPGPDAEVDPAKHATMYLRLDNRTAIIGSSVHITTSEPDCDFPDIRAVVKNEGTNDEQSIDACGIVRLKKGDTLTIHFKATDINDGHLEKYTLYAHWKESDEFDLLSSGALAGDPDPLYGPTYADTFAGVKGVQGAYRASLPSTDPECNRPIWFGGNFKVTLTVDDPLPGNLHRVFETCCAYLLRLDVWKRTTDGCTIPRWFHYNQCEFSFTVIREDLIGKEGHPSCSDKLTKSVT
jgi:hypothetical protein